MFSHIQIGARDLPKMVAFYDAVLGCLGLERIEGEHDSGPPGRVAAPRQALATGFRPVAFQRPARHLGQWHASELRR